MYNIAWTVLLEIKAQTALQILSDEHSAWFPLDRLDEYVSRAGNIGGINANIATLMLASEIK